MTQIKFFSGMLMKEMGTEKKINDWLKQHPEFDVKDIKFQADRGGHNTDTVFIAVIYKVKGEKRDE